MIIVRKYTRIAAYTLVAVAGVLFAGTGCSSDSTPAIIARADTTASAQAKTAMYPIGQAEQFDTVQVAAFYSQPATMEPAMGLSAADSDIHLESEVTALPNNHLGFAAGEWIPYLTIDYQITAPDGTTSKGDLMPMTGSCGQHYGSNVKLGAAGTYKISYTVHSPVDNGFMVHVDPATGVTGHFWTTPLQASWDFNYLPRKW